MGLLPLNYRRPQYVKRDSANNSETSSLSESSDGSTKDGVSSSIAGIPPALSFDKILEGGTCPVCKYQSRGHPPYIECRGSNSLHQLRHGRPY